MTKEVKINFSYVKGEFLVSLFENGKLVDWKIADTTMDVKRVISDFYFPEKND